MTHWSRVIVSHVLALSLTTTSFALHAQQATSQADPKVQDEIKTLRADAERGDAASQYLLGLRLAGGIGVNKDDVQAAQWFRKAADGGLADAQLFVGIGYAEGRGVAKDDAQALAWFRKAADHGSDSAKAWLGDMYLDGRGVIRDRELAFQWYSKAAEEGEPRAQFNLGALLYGTQGFQRDLVESYKWFDIATTTGADTDQGRRSAGSRDRVARDMTPAQIAEAQKRARAWLAAFDRRAK